MDSPFAPFEPEGEAPPRFDNGRLNDGRGAKLHEIPLRKLIPNIITLLAICAGISGIRMAYEGRFELAVGLVLLAAFLDGIDGRIARLLKRRNPAFGRRDGIPLWPDIVKFSGVAPRA
ncbi:MAG: CDP-diacylglycerol--serine O-phosphatidyltransferase, partial [Phyllobacteriaceae bacterium]|nr:CDP-diacylglycerol--serine O-phosphatidyltransferase [Phyllobacteriaceae bacterium]